MIETSKHDLIKAEIFLACNDLGFYATQEYNGKGWRTDVFAVKDTKKIAFEIQISPQSLKKTLERQEKYIRDEIIGCWLFERSPAKLTDERPELPLFYVTEQKGKMFSVSISGRKEIPLHNFLEQFLSGNIKFCKIACTSPEQKVKLVFYEMECWQCKEMNHIYFVETNFYSACNAVIHSSETLWGSDKNEYRPEIISLAKEFTKMEQGSQIKLGAIKQRFSNTIQGSYMSFGCYNCDSIFGDWYVMEAQLEAVYGFGQVATIEGKVKLNEKFDLPIPHWCYPCEMPFCDES